MYVSARRINTSSKYHNRNEHTNQITILLVCKHPDHENMPKVNTYDVSISVVLFALSDINV